MLPAIQPLNDPRLERRNFLTILFGSSGAGKSRLSLTAYPDVLLADFDGTIGRFREQAEGRVVYVETDHDIIALARAIAAGEISVKTLVIDGFTRLVQRLESELGTLHRDAYYRTYRERIDTLMRALSTVPCNVVLTARARPIRAKAGDVVGGYLVAAGESVPIGETPDVPPGVTDSADLVLHLESTDEAWSAETVKSLLGELPQHESFSDPIAQIPERIKLITERLDRNPSPEPPAPALTPATAAQAPPAVERGKTANGQVAAVVASAVPTNAELKTILKERNGAVDPSAYQKSVLDYLAKVCGWNQVIPVPDDLRIFAKAQMLEEIRTGKEAPAPESPDDVIEYIKERVPGSVEVTPPAEQPAEPPPEPADRKVTNAELLTLLRHRNAICQPSIRTVPEYMREQCGLSHVTSASEITPADRIAMLERATTEIAEAHNPLTAKAAHQD